MTTFANLIPIERLTTGTVIYLRAGNPSGHVGFVEVSAIKFDGEGYGVDLLWGRYGDMEEFLYVAAGETVEFGGLGEPKLRRASEVTADEAYALAEACAVPALQAAE